jgi:hypothetical protein
MDSPVMTSSDQLQILTDHVLPDPLVRSSVTDQDGRKRITYTPAPSPDAPNIDGIVQAQHELHFYNPGTTYRKYSIVRKGTVDYLALEQTSTDPELGPWVVVRVNQKGPDGDDGGDTVI